MKPLPSSPHLPRVPGLLALIIACGFLLLPGGMPDTRAATYTNSNPAPWTNASAWTGTALNTNDDAGVIWLRTSGTNPTLTNNYTIVFLNQLVDDTVGKNLILLGTGTLQFTNSGASVQNNTANSFTLNEALNVTAATVFRATNTGSIIVSSNISGVGSLIISNTGTGYTRLAGSNTFNGGVTMVAGTLQLANTWALGTGSLTIANNVFLDTGANATTIASTNNQAWNSSFTFSGANGKTLTMGPGTVTLGTNVTLTVSANTFTVPGSITGAWALVKAGTGTLSLGGNSTYSGGTTISNGTLQVTSGSALSTGAVTVVGGSVLQFKVGAASTNNSGIISGEGMVDFNSGSSAIYMFSSNAYSGGTLFTGGGRVSLGNDSALGTNFITFTTNGAGFTLTSTEGATRTLANNLVISNKVTFGVQAEAGNLIFTGGVDLGGAIRELSLTTNTVIMSGVLANGGVYKTGSGTLILSNANNSYTLGTTNSAGAIALGNDNVLGSGTLVMNGGTLQAADGTARTLTNALVFAANPIFGSAATGNLTLGSPFIDLGTGARLITVSNTLTTLQGILTNTASLIKAGPGTLALAGANTYSGGTILSNGTLSVGAVNALLAAGAVTVAGGVYDLGGFSVTNGAFTLTGGTVSNGSLAATSFLFSPGPTTNLTSLANLVGTGAMTKSGAGTLVLNGANTYSGGTTNTAGALALGINNALGSGTLVMNGGTLQAADGTARTLTNALVFAANPIFGSAATGNLTLGSPFIDLGTGARLITVSNTLTTLQGILTNTASLIKAGPGTLALDGPSTYSGGTILSNGTLSVGAVNALLAAGAVTVAGGVYDLGGFSVTNGAFTATGGAVSNGSLVATSFLFNPGSSTNITVQASLVGPGALAKNGAGTLTLGNGGLIDATTPVTINAGILTVNEGAAVNGTVLANAGTFNMNGGSATLNSLVVTNTALLTLGYGTLTTTAGSTFNNGGSLVVGTTNTMTWSMLGGTHVTGTNGSSLSITLGGVDNTFSTGRMVVAGPATVWSNGMSLWLGGGLSSTKQTNSVGQMVISNGAVVYVTGSSSTISGLAVGSQGAGSSLTLADGGKLYYSGANAFSLGANTSSSNNTILVTGLGSVLSTTTNRGINMGTKNSGGGGNQITVASEATVVTAGLAMGGAFTGSGASTNIDAGVGSSNTVLVYGPGTLWSNANASVAVVIGFSGTGNRLVVSNHALFAGLGLLTLGNSAGNTSNQLLVADGARLTAAGTTIGNNGVHNSMVISDGGIVLNSGSGGIGSSGTAISNSVLVTGGSSVWSNGNLTVGGSGSYNTLTITGGASVVSAAGTIGAAGSNNTVLVSGIGSAWNGSGVFNLGNSGGSGNRLLILSSGLVSSVGSTLGGVLGANPLNSSNLVVITGGATWSNTSTLTIGSWNGLENQVWVTNGGTFVSTGGIFLGANTNSRNNRLVISDSSSLANIQNSNLHIGDGTIGGGNMTVVSNGATFTAGAVAVGLGATSSNNLLFVSGSNTLVRLSSGLMVGSNAAGINSSPNLNGHGSVLVNEGATLEANWLQVGYNGSGVISNLGGIYQFTTNTPKIVSNTTNAIVLNSATIAFRDVTDVNVKGNWGVGALGRALTNITFAGENAFRLNNASTTNGGQDYVFDTGRGATNYTRLEMINGTTLWQGGSLTIGGGGTMLVSNTAATVANAFTNQGSVRVVGSTLTLGQPLVVTSNASFTLVHATNVLNGGLVIASNAFYGGSGRVESGPGVTSFGTISPGNSPGTLTFSSNLTLLDSSVLHLEIAGTNALDYDHLIVEGTLFMGGSIYMTNLVGWTFAKGDTFNFIDATNWSGHFLSQSSWILPDLGEDLQWDTRLFEIQGIMSVMQIPEPSPFLAVGAGLALLAFLRRRRA